MVRLLLHRGTVRSGVAMALVGALLVFCLLLRSLPARAGHGDTRAVLITAPLAVARGQSAEIAFYLPAAQNQQEPVNVRLQLVDAVTGRVLAQQDIVADGPGGGCLQLPAGDQQSPMRQEVVGILIALLRPGTSLPTASLQVFNIDTQKTTAALPAVQLVANEGDHR